MVSLSAGFFADKSSDGCTAFSVSAYNCPDVASAYLCTSVAEALQQYPIPAEQHNQHELDPKELNMNNPNRSTEQQKVVPCKHSHGVMKT